VHSGKEVIQQTASNHHTLGTVTVNTSEPSKPQFTLHHNPEIPVAVHYKSLRLSFKQNRN